MNMERKWTARDILSQEIRSLDELIGSVPERKEPLPKEIEYTCRYIWDLPTISAQKMVELIRKYNEGTADSFEKMLVEIFRSHVADYQDREVWEFFFPGEEMPEPTRWWKEPMRLREERRKKK